MTPQEILNTLSARDPFVRANARRWTPVTGVLTERAGLLQMEQGTLVGTGEVPAVASLLAQTEFTGVGHALMPMGMAEYAGELVHKRLGLTPIGSWTWLYSRTPPPVTPGEEHVGALDASLDEIAAALSVANPDTHAAHDLEAHDWWGFQQDGRILGLCAVDDYGVEPGTPAAAVHGVNLSGLGTLPEARGRGVGSAMMAGITRHFVGSHGLVHYGVWDDNEIAFRIYRRLGYTSGPQIQSFSRHER